MRFELDLTTNPHRIVDTTKEEYLDEDEIVALLNKYHEEEKLYAQEILRLNTIIKETNQFKDILGDY